VSVIRPGTPADEPALLELFDEAVEWMLARGQPGQWGAELPSTREDWRASIHALACEAGLYMLELDGRAAAALALGEAPEYVPPTDEPEIYILLVLSTRADRGRGLGGDLLAHAERRAREAGVSRLRVDCWADAPSLVGWYERYGFIACGEFERRGWRGQILSRPVPYEPPDG
jgi:GNAT superfamily N-acetyltransferase